MLAITPHRILMLYSQYIYYMSLSDIETQLTTDYNCILTSPNWYNLRCSLMKAGEHQIKPSSVWAQDATGYKRENTNLGTR